MLIYFYTVPRRIRRRRQEFDGLSSCIAYGEIVAKVALAFILLVLPFLISPAPFGDLGAFLWWLKGWTPVWVMVTMLLYLPLVLTVAPRQLTGASVEAMAQASAGQEPVHLPAPMESECILATSLMEANDRRVQVIAKVYRQLLFRRSLPSYQLHFPCLRFIPLPSSRDFSD